MSSFARWNTHFSTTVELEAFDHTWTFKQNPSSEHLGTSVWDASIVAAKFFEKSATTKRGEFSREKTKGKRALELGAGMGVGSCGLAMLGMDVDCTDVGEVMTLLKSNIEHNLNRSSLTAKSNAWSGAVGKVRVQELDWLNDAHLANFTPPYDYIMLADCVYHEELIEALMKVILAMSNKKTVVLVANEYRSKSVHDRWMELCKTNFNVKRVPQDKMHPDFSENVIELYIMKLLKSKKAKDEGGDEEEGELETADPTAPEKVQGEMPSGNAAETAGTAEGALEKLSLGP